MECKVGYIRGHGFSTLEELGLPVKSAKNVVWAHCLSIPGQEPVTGSVYGVITMFIY